MLFYWWYICFIGSCDAANSILKSSYAHFKISTLTCLVESDQHNILHAAHSDTTVAKMLVGNKCDLGNIRDVSVEEGKSLAESEGLFFMETSALDSTNVKKAFEIVIREIYNNVSRKVLNSDSYKAELSVNRVSLVNDGTDGSKQTGGSYSCCSRWPKCLFNHNRAWAIWLSYGWFIYPILFLYLFLLYCLEWDPIMTNMGFYILI